MSANRMHFLLPTKRITDIIQCWFARALCLYGKGIEISAFVFLSNHWHILCRDTKGTLAAFDDVEVDGDNEFIDRYAYTMGNAVKAGLVEKSDEWPGWSSLEGALSDGKYCFEMLNKTKLHNATRRGQKVNPSKSGSSS